MIKMFQRRVQSAGWVNVYNQRGRLRFSNMQYESKESATSIRPTDPLCEYIDTVELFMCPSDLERLKNSIKENTNEKARYNP